MDDNDSGNPEDNGPELYVINLLAARAIDFGFEPGDEKAKIERCGFRHFPLLRCSRANKALYRYLFKFYSTKLPHTILFDFAEDMTSSLLFDTLAIMTELPMQSILPPENSTAPWPLIERPFLLVMTTPDCERVAPELDSVLREIAVFLRRLVEQSQIRVFTTSEGVSAIHERLQHWIGF